MAQFASPDYVKEANSGDSYSNVVFEKAKVHHVEAPKPKPRPPKMS